ncbi:hypothetical protein I4U23_022799 [Adineta vaga]|nr:hypothetical protein I4U23_022799 [Adineta vaga]
MVKTRNNSCWGNGFGRRLDQLAHPFGIFLDDNDTIYIADLFNHRIVMWPQNATIGQWVAGLTVDGDDTHELQLNMPRDIIVDKNGTVYISDRGNYRVVRCDNQGFIYVSEYAKGHITKWNFNDDQFVGEIVARNLGQTD